MRRSRGIWVGMLSVVLFTMAEAHGADCKQQCFREKTQCFNDCVAEYGGFPAKVRQCYSGCHSIYVACVNACKSTVDPTAVLSEPEFPLQD